LAAATLAHLSGRYLPLLDLPNHLSAMPSGTTTTIPTGTSPSTTLNLVPLPYWAHYYTVHLLTYVTRSVELANKIFLSGYALAVPLAALLFCRRFERSPWLALFTFRWCGTSISPTLIAYVPASRWCRWRWCWSTATPSVHLPLALAVRSSARSPTFHCSPMRCSRRAASWYCAATAVHAALLALARCRCSVAPGSACGRCAAPTA